MRNRPVRGVRGPDSNNVAIKDIVDLVLRVKLPEGRTLLPGLISHATNVVEHPELVAERIVRLAKLVGRDNVIASTDCGFA